MQHTSLTTLRRLVVPTLAVLALIATRQNAYAGGLEYPDNGVEAVGRGAAFTAKADDGTALIYNVAGFARQRGWRLTVGANTAFTSDTFQRSGVYPDSPTDKLTPWGGQKFPLVKNTGSPVPIPHLILSTDLGTDRLTVGLGIYAPSVLGGRIFPLGVDGKPSPARYDSVSGGGLIAYPSLFGAYRVTDWLDVGLAANFVIASLDATSMSSADLAKALCPNQEYQPCDSRQSVKTTGGTVAFSIGAMLRPTKSIEIGAQFRTPYKLETEGTVTAQAPNVQPAPIAPGQAFLTQPFPWVLRTGIRYIAMEDKREAWDVEADFTYEAWGAALHDGTQVYIPKLSLFDNIHSTIQLGFKDTMSLRVGGAYNIPLGASPTAASTTHPSGFDPRDILFLRAGAFHDTAATDNADTRLIFDTFAKTGITAGVGYKRGPVTLNFAITKIFEETRTVTDGTVKPINGSQGGQSLDSTGAPYNAVNNGTYTASTFTVAAGVTIELDSIFGGARRVPSFGADYEVTASPSSSSTPPSPPSPGNQEDDEAKKPSEPTQQPVVATIAPPTEPRPDRMDARWWDGSSSTTTASEQTTSPSTSPKKPVKKKKTRTKASVQTSSLR